MRRDADPVFPREWLWILLPGAALITLLGAFGMFDGGAYAHNIQMWPWR